MNEFHVGLPCMKLSLNPSNQKHHGKASRTCMAGDAWKEMNDERRGKDTTIDKTLTHNNVWLAGSSDMNLTAMIQKEIDRVNEEKKEHGKRRLRSDCVSGIEMIEKPPMDVMQEMSREEQIKFLEDSYRTVGEILSDWNPEWKTAAAVMHFDEFGGRSPHTHRIIIPVSKDDDGVLTMNAKKEFNLKFFTFVNKEYPKRMRAIGYPVKDCKIYDEMTEEQKKEHRENRPDYGLESYDFKQKKIKEQTKTIEDQSHVIDDNDSRIASQEKVIEENIRTTSALSQQKEKLQVEILSATDIKNLTEPEKTFTGNCYKIPVQEYMNLLATARQAVVMKQQNQKWKKKMTDSFDKREHELNVREKALEEKSRITIPEKIELFTLRTLKKSVEWICDRLPENNFIRYLLEKALGGSDLTHLPEMTTRDMEKTDRLIREGYRPVLGKKKPSRHMR